jgi:hypothetical protein
VAEQAEADDVHDIEDEDLEIGEPDDQVDENEGEGDQDAAEDDEDGESVEILFGDEAAPASESGSEPDLIRKLRDANREQAKKLAAYERGDLQPPKQPQVIEVGEKPTMESCDYDEGKFETELDAWKERGRQAEEAKAQVNKQHEAERAELEKDLQRYAEKRDALKIRDFEAVKADVVAAMSPNHISAIIQAAKDPAKVIYALGKHPAKLAALAAMTNFPKFIAAIVEVEGTLKVTKTTRNRPEPESTVRGSAPLSAASKDKHLAKLEAKASQTGNRTDLIAYRAKLKKRSK